MAFFYASPFGGEKAIAFEDPTLAQGPSGRITGSQENSDKKVNFIK
jgi:hypothetical protein